jgi:hypothetical protein
MPEQIKEEALVTIWVSDPWEFPDENQGRLAFVARIVGTANGQWLLRLSRPIQFERMIWNFAIPSPRLLGGWFFDDHSEFGTPASIHFITDEQAVSRRFLDAYDSQLKQTTPWVLGSLERGVSQRIPSGSDSYVSPTWKPILANGHDCP